MKILGVLNLSKTKILFPCGVQRFQNEATLIKDNFRTRAFETRIEFIENKCGNCFVTS